MGLDSEMSRAIIRLCRSVVANYTLTFRTVSAWADQCTRSWCPFIIYTHRTRILTVVSWLSRRKTLVCPLFCSLNSSRVWWVLALLLIRGLLRMVYVEYLQGKWQLMYINRVTDNYQYGENASLDSCTKSPMYILIDDRVRVRKRLNGLAQMASRMY